MTFYVKHPHHLATLVVGSFHCLVPFAFLSLTAVVYSLMKKKRKARGGSRQPQIINVANTNPSGHGMNGSVYFAEGLAPTLTTNKGEGIKVMTIENVRLKT